MKLILPLLAALLFVVPALAQHAHGGKGPNGGVIEDVAGVEAELVIAGNVVTIHVFDEQKKAIPTSGFSGSALIVTGSERETLTLTPSGDNLLKGQAKRDIGKGATVSIVLKTAAGKSGQARYKN